MITAAVRRSTAATFAIKMLETVENRICTKITVKTRRFPSVPVIAIVPSKIEMKSPVSKFNELCREDSCAVAPVNELFSEASFQISTFQRSKSGTEKKKGGKHKNERPQQGKFWPRSTSKKVTTLKYVKRTGN